jgi:hypothetical protein
VARVHSRLRPRYLSNKPKPPEVSKASISLVSRPAMATGRSVETENPSRLYCWYKIWKRRILAPLESLWATWGKLASPRNDACLLSSFLSVVLPRLWRWKAIYLAILVNVSHRTPWPHSQYVCFSAK